MDIKPNKYIALLLFKVSAWLSYHAVCKIGLTSLFSSIKVRGRH